MRLVGNVNMMHAFLSPNLPTYRCRPRVQTTCCAEGPLLATRLSLPTTRERRYLELFHVKRGKGRPIRSSHTSTFILKVWPLVVDPQENSNRIQSRRSNNSKPDRTRNNSFELERPKTDGFYSPGYVSSVENSSEFVNSIQKNGRKEWMHRENEPFTIPPWAYIARVHASKQNLGKRAVQRNRAKRVIRAAAAQIWPQHARRGFEYVFTAMPEVLTIAFPDLVVEMKQALQNAGLWEDSLTIEMLRREKYCRR